MIHLAMIRALVLVIASTIPMAAFAAETRETRLPTMVVEDASPTDLLNQDPLLPLQSGESSTVNGSGNAQKSLLDHIPLNSTSYGKAGALSQFRGLGRSADDTQVQSLGVSLNPAQGGGFDFSTFPQYLWSDFQFQLSPGLAALDARANSGVVSLIPWTQNALASKGKGARLTGFGASSSLGQFSVGVKTTDDFAILAGWSVGAAQGPSGSVSGRWGSGAIRGHYHLLATNLKSEISGPFQARTPEARLRTVRVIPIFQVDADLSQSMLLKTSFFYDSNYLKTSIPEKGTQIRDHVIQGGVDSALVWKNWKLGASVRRTAFSNDGYSLDPSGGFTSRFKVGETLASAQIAPIFEAGQVQIAPTFQGVSLSGFDIRPAGSLGIRFDFGSGHSFFGRTSYSNRFPTLSDRFYSAGDIRSNPGLTIEIDRTDIVGWEFKQPGFQVEVDLYSQTRTHTIQGVPTAFGYTSANLGNAQVDSLLHQATYSFLNHFAVREAGSFVHSKVEKTGLPFPYQPRLTQLLAFDVVDQIGYPRWRGSIVGRAQSSELAPIFRGAPTFFTDTHAELPSSSYLDLEAKVMLYQGRGVLGLSKVDLIALVENVLDRDIELQRDYPLEGRIGSVGVVGQF